MNRRNEWRIKKPRNEEAKKSRWIEEWRSQEAKNEEPQEAKNEEAKKNSKNPKNHTRSTSKYFIIFNTSLFYKPFSTTSKSI